MVALLSNLHLTNGTDCPSVNHDTDPGQTWGRRSLSGGAHAPLLPSVGLYAYYMLHLFLKLLCQLNSYYSFIINEILQKQMEQNKIKVPYMKPLSILEGIKVCL